MSNSQNANVDPCLVHHLLNKSVDLVSYGIEVDTYPYSVESSLSPHLDNINLSRDPAKFEVHIGYSPYETMCYFEAYVDASKDTVFENQQKTDGFWQKVANKYNRIYPRNTPEWTGCMLWDPFERPNTEVTKFFGICNALERECQSGESQANILNDAMQAYQSDYKRAFKFAKAWAKVRNCPKWVGGELSTLVLL